ncbi:MAG: S8 family serine peptidase [Candidatus Margulisiibacteriota bacterium]
MKKILAALFVFFGLFSFSHANIEPRLMSTLSTLSPSEEISVMVYMKDKVAISSLSGTRKDKISSLQRFSEKSQRGIADLLGKKKGLDKRVAFKQFWTFNGFALRAPKEVIEELAGRDDVERIALNSTLFLPPRPKEVLSPLSAHPLSATVEDNIALIKADKVWDNLGFRGTGVKVGIADTGALSTHPDLSGKISLQASFNSVGTQISTDAPDTNGHGTHVAGIIAGGNASGKYIGAAPEADLIIAKVFNDSGTGTFAQVVGGIEWLITNDAKIVNLSLGSDSVGIADTDWKNMVDTWDSVSKVLIVAAIGNGGPPAETTTSPGNVPNALGIGAVLASDDIWSGSSRGPILWSGTIYIKPDISAPGVSIKSSYNNGDYEYMTGTSMACPHTSAVAALMLQANPTLETSTIRTIVENTAYRKDTVSYPNNDYGAGRLDALAAVTAAAANDTTPPTIETPSHTTSIFKQSITVSAVITDNYTNAPTAVLFYKNDTQVWKNTPMTKESASNLYDGVIPAEDVLSNIDYYIQAVDGAGNVSRSPSLAPSDTHNIETEQTTSVILSGLQTCPNPFAPGKESATFFYELSKPAQTTVRIMNLRGETVKVIDNSGTFGTNSFTWDGIFEDGQIATNGVYIYQIVARDIEGSSASAKGKMIVLK